MKVFYYVFYENIYDIDTFWLGFWNWFAFAKAVNEKRLKNVFFFVTKVYTYAKQWY